MRKFLALTLAVMAAGWLVVAPPVSAHEENGWYQTNCTEFNGNPDPRWDVWWQPHVNDDAHYWTERWGSRLVAGWIMWKYAQLDYQCGWLGPPTAEAYVYGAGQTWYYIQHFQCGYIAWQYAPRFYYPSVHAWSGGCD